MMQPCDAGPALGDRIRMQIFNLITKSCMQSTVHSASSNVYARRQNVCHIPSLIQGV